MGREEKKGNNPKKSLRRSRSAVKGTGKMGRREKGVQEASKISWRVSLETVRKNRNAENPRRTGGSQRTIARDLFSLIFQ